MNLGELGNKEICHNSVVLAGKSLTGASLDCNTEYVCISGGGECEGFNYGRKVEVDASDKNEIMKVIADEMVDCWWMFGEGKVEYVKGYRDFHCGICSIIEFDSEIKEKYSSNGIFHYLRFYDFLSESNLDDSQIYLNYLYDLNSKINTKLKFKAEKLVCDSFI